MKKMSLSKLLLKWYQHHGRSHLPWRESVTSYRVWLSEIMLQQTQVATVIPYYQRFLQEFPDIKSLAAASLDQVLYLWSGLGYYARGRHLHRCAQEVVTRFHDVFPSTKFELMSLPGIGESTAGAILALAYDKPEAILDGNVKRVLTRVFAIAGYPEQAAIKKQLWQLAQSLVPKKNCHEYTQALMDLGATVCTPKDPSCTVCPLQKMCQSFLLDMTTLYPTPKPAKKIPTKKVYWLIAITKQQEVLLEQRPATGIWGNLWCFPECTINDNFNTWARTALGISVIKKKQLTVFTHVFTHFKLQVTPVIIYVQKKSHLQMERAYCWYSLEQPKKLGIATPSQRVLKQLQREVL